MNYFCYNIFFFIITFSFVSADTLQPILLADQDYYNISQNDVASTNAGIQLFDLICKILVAPLYGILTDTVGRKFFIVFGIVCMATGILFMPFVGIIYPYYIIFRLIFANGAIACLCSPLLADYVYSTTKGRAASILVILAAFGAVFSTFVCLDLSNLSVGARYIAVATIVLVGGLVSSLGIKGGDYFKTNISSTDNESIQSLEQPKAKKDLKFYFSGFLEARNPWILMGYFVSFLSRGDSALLTYTIVLWAQKYYPSDQNSQNQAAIQAQTLAGVAYSMIFLSAIIYGFWADKFSKFKLTIFVLGITVVGLIMLVYAPSPTSALAWASMGPIGLGMGGLLTTSLQFVNKYASKKCRGNINAISTLMGVLGIFSISVIGGYMIDSVSSDAPFLLYAGFCMMGMVILLIISFFHKDLKNDQAYDQVNQIY